MSPSSLDTSAALEPHTEHKEKKSRPVRVSNLPYNAQVQYNVGASFDAELRTISDKLVIVFTDKNGRTRRVSAMTFAIDPMEITNRE